MGASAILKLQKVGFSVEQGEALADFMDTQAASKIDLEAAKGDLKSDIAGVKGDLELTRSELKAEIADVKAELKAEIAAVRTDLEASVHRLDMAIADVKAGIKLLGHQMTITLGGMMILAVTVLLAAMRYLPPHP